MRFHELLIAAALAASGGAQARPHVVGDFTDGKPDAIVDLRSSEAAKSVAFIWKTAEARFVETDFKGPGPDLRATGAPVKTFDLAPSGPAALADDRPWERIAPEALEMRRGTGRVSGRWYRLDVTLPESIGETEVAGATVVFEIVVDDYAEVWVDGEMRHPLGAVGGAVIQGFNAPNRIVLTRDARPGRSFRIGVYAANGPLSEPPSNFIWVRSATLDIYRAARGREAFPRGGEVVSRDPALAAIVPRDASIEKLAEGFSFIEGPVWHPDGYLLFSEPNDNRIWRYDPFQQDLTIYRSHSGYTGADIGAYGQPGSNGLALDAEGRLTVDEHGNRRVVRIERTGAVTVLADRHEGKRLNSPNDLVYRSDGSLYFTDPPFGLPKIFDDPRKELPFSGVFVVKGGSVRLLADELTGPNGLAFSPDERFLYVDNWDTARKVVMRYPVLADGGLGPGTVFFDMKDAPGEEALDGLKVDSRGNVYVSGPGGVWVLSPEGRHLGTIRGPELPANFAFGDADRKALYMTARGGLYRIRLLVAGK